jgi:hypothetical protein
MHARMHACDSSACCAAWPGMSHKRTYHTHRTHRTHCIARIDARKSDRLTEAARVVEHVAGEVFETERRRVRQLLDEAAVLCVELAPHAGRKPEVVACERVRARGRATCPTQAARTAGNIKTGCVRGCLCALHTAGL